MKEYKLCIFFAGNSPSNKSDDIKSVVRDSIYAYRWIVFASYIVQISKDSIQKYTFSLTLLLTKTSRIDMMMHWTRLYLAVADGDRLQTERQNSLWIKWSRFNWTWAMDTLPDNYTNMTMSWRIVLIIWPPFLFFHEDQLLRWWVPFCSLNLKSTKNRDCMLRCFLLHMLFITYVNI